MTTPRPTPVPPVDPPNEVPEPNDEPDDVDDYDLPCTDADDARWDVFIPDEDECDPLPDPGDFWGRVEHGAGSEEPD
jgi:hypothetical protein